MRATRTHAAERPPHAPEAGWSVRLLGRFHLTGIFWYRFNRWLVTATPDWLMAPLIAFMTPPSYAVLVRVRRALGANLAAALGPAGFLERQRRVLRTIRTFGMCLIERYERFSTDRPFAVEVEALEHWRAVADGGRGFVMVTGHIGLYEAGSMVPVAKAARRVHLVREPELDPRAQAFIEETVAAVQGADYRMHFQTGNPLQAVALVEALDRGEIVAVQADRPHAGGKTVDATLFGRPFPLPAGPAVLARTAQVPMLPVFALREGRRRFRLVFRPPIEVGRTADRSADLAAAMRSVAGEIEYAIRRAPEQWFAFRELWPRS
jgi:phosphatidylinositol dimannoside acyltransferase